MQPPRFNPITGHYLIELTGGSGKVESRRWRLFAVFMLAFSVFHLTSPMVALSQSVIPVVVFNSPMTITGSTGAVDEEDLTEYEVRNQFATIRDSVATATVTYRYNIVPVDGLKNCSDGILGSGLEANGAIFGACCYNIRIRYRDTGANQNVIVRLRAANTTMDGVTTIYEFNSDSPDSAGNPAPPNSGSNQTVDHQVLLPPPHITHGDRVYFLEVAISKLAIDGTPSPGFVAFVIGSAIRGCDMAES